MQIREFICTIYIEETLAELINLCPGDPADYIIRLESAGYDSDVLNIYKLREETSEEQARRMQAQERAQMHHKESRQRLYENLKKEFG